MDKLAVLWWKMLRWKRNDFDELFRLICLFIRRPPVQQNIQKRRMQCRFLPASSNGSDGDRRIGESSAGYGNRPCNAIITWLHNTQRERKRKTKTVKGRNNSTTARHPFFHSILLGDSTDKPETFFLHFFKILLADLKQAQCIFIYRIVTGGNCWVDPAETMRFHISLCLQSRN